MQYAEALQQVMAEEPPVAGRSREEMEAAVAAITAQLKGPLRNDERIMLFSSRAALRKALADIA